MYPRGPFFLGALLHNHLRELSHEMIFLQKREPIAGENVKCVLGILISNLFSSSSMADAFQNLFSSKIIHL